MQITQPYCILKNLTGHSTTLSNVSEALIPFVFTPMTSRPLDPCGVTSLFTSIPFLCVQKSKCASRRLTAVPQNPALKDVKMLFITRVQTLNWLKKGYCLERTGGAQFLRTTRLISQTDNVYTRKQTVCTRFRSRQLKRKGNAGRVCTQKANTM